MVASNLFGRGMGKSRLKAILKNYPDILTSKASATAKREEISSLDGFGKKTSSVFVKNIPIFKRFLKETGLLKKLTQQQPTQKLDKNH